ncbi:MAG: hypothetical protein U0T84_06245 [Chitinophagales bacterium]
MKIRTLIVVFTSLFAAVILESPSSGPGNGSLNGSGSKGVSGCSCHATTTSIGTSLELDSAGVPVTSYVPGMSYTVKITAVNGTATSWPCFGFQLSTVKLSGAGTSIAVQAGTWGTALPNTHAITVNAISVAEHTLRQTPASGTGGTGTVYRISYPWTAPATGTGSVKVYGLILAGNGAGSSGDGYQLASPITITEAVQVVNASVSIAVTNGSNPTCSGATVGLTATPTNGGGAPTYQWKVNGANAGTGATFNSSSLNNNDTISCVMTSNLAGVSNNPATSNKVVITVNPTVTPSVVAAATSSTSICGNASLTFSATPTNGGTPTYSWKRNGTTVGTNSNSYTGSGFANGDSVWCVMTSSATCANPATVTSNKVRVTVKNTSIGAISRSICPGGAFFFNGVNRTTAGTYLDTLTNAVGCDSFLTLTLSLKSTSASTLNKSICQGGSFFFNGVNRTAAGTYLDTLTNVAGCDSFITLNLALKATSSSVLNKGICPGGSFFFKGQNRTVPGTYVDTLLNAAGCDSIITLNLTQKQATNGSISASICTGQSYFFNGANRTVAGTYADTLVNAAGCDSFLTLNLSVGNYATRNANARICAGDIYNFYGRQLSIAGVYRDTFANAGSCDSVIILNLSVGQPNSSQIANAICEGDQFNFNGTMLSAAGTYRDTLLNAAGCDSVVTLSLSVNAAPTVSVSRSGYTLTASASGVTYQWYRDNQPLNGETNPTIQATVNGSYTVKVTNGSGCFVFSDPISVTNVGIAETGANAVSWRPNPVRDWLYLNASEPVQELHIRNVMGQDVIVISEGEVNAVDCSALHSGIYLLEWHTSSGKGLGRLVKE